MKYNYVQAPLPFQGQKRRFLKPFKEALNEFPADAVYIDLFGGSGLLSHTVKDYYPDAKVIYNDLILILQDWKMLIIQTLYYQIFALFVVMLKKEIRGLMMI